MRRWRWRRWLLGLRLFLRLLFLFRLFLGLLLFRRRDELDLNALIFCGLRLDIRQAENEERDDGNMHEHGRDHTPANARLLVLLFVVRICRFDFVFCHSSDVAFKTGSIKPQIEKTS